MQNDENILAEQNHIVLDSKYLSKKISFISLPICLFDLGSSINVFSQTFLPECIFDF